MARVLEVALTSEDAQALVEEALHTDGVLGVQMQRGAALKPPGDVVRLTATTDGLLNVMQALERRQLLRRPGVSFTVSSPDAAVSPPDNARIRNDFSDATWEEMECEVAKQGNIDLNALLLMALAGAMAAIGIATNSLHVVVGAMVLAPGFEPVLRVSLAAVSGGVSWRRGMADTVKGYASMAVGAAAATWALDLPPSLSLDTTSDYLPRGVLIQYWTSISAASLLVTAAASVAGALVVVMRRSVLTTGVMIALAFVPAATLVGMSLVVGDWDTAGRAALRWTVELSAVLLAGLAVFSWKRFAVQKRKTSL